MSSSPGQGMGVTGLVEKEERVSIGSRHQYPRKSDSMEAAMESINMRSTGRRLRATAASGGPLCMGSPHYMAGKFPRADFGVRNRLHAQIWASCGRRVYRGVCLVDGPGFWGFWVEPGKASRGFWEALGKAPVRSGHPRFASLVSWGLDSGPLYSTDQSD